MLNEPIPIKTLLDSMHDVRRDLKAARDWERMVNRQHHDAAIAIANLLRGHIGEIISIIGRPSWALVRNVKGTYSMVGVGSVEDRETPEPWLTTLPLESVSDDNRNINLIDHKKDITKVAGFVIPIVTIEELRFEDHEINHAADNLS